MPLAENHQKCNMENAFFLKTTLGEITPSSTLIHPLPFPPRLPEQFQRVAQCSWADLGVPFGDIEESGFHSIIRMISKMQPCREVQNISTSEYSKIPVLSPLTLKQDML